VTERQTALAAYFATISLDPRVRRAATPDQLVASILACVQEDGAVIAQMMLRRAGEVAAKRAETLVSSGVHRIVETVGRAFAQRAR
jgi:hypothetical protein